MGAFSTRMKALASKLTAKYGQSVTVTRDVEGGFNPATGAVGTGTTTTFTMNCYPYPYTNEEIDGTMIEMGDIRLITEMVQPPLVGDVVTLDAKQYRVMNVSKLTAQGEDVAYQLQLRI